jgi:hypothetical protein
MKGIQPPQVDEADKPLRREVAMAYRSAREAGQGHASAYEAGDDGVLRRPARRAPPSGLGTGLRDDRLGDQYRPGLVLEESQVAPPRQCHRGETRSMFRHN